MQNRKHKRYLRNFLINPKFQFRYIFWLTSSGLILVGVNSAIAYSYIKENYLTLVELSPMTDEARAQMYLELRQLLLSISFVSLAFIVLMALVGVVISHKTAGPLYHFKRVFEEIKSGKREQRIRLRPGDEFHDVANSFNEMMESLNSTK